MMCFPKFLWLISELISVRNAASREGSNEVPASPPKLLIVRIIKVRSFLSNVSFSMKTKLSVYLFQRIVADLLV